VVQAPGIIFKGSGFYVTDSKSASKKSLNGASHSNGSSDSTSGETSSKVEKAVTESKAATPEAAD
jgi:predicted nucleic acid-binding Zn ribbon protein